MKLTGKHAVLCCDLHVLESLPLVKQTTELFHYTPDVFEAVNFHFFNRVRVDALAKHDPQGFVTGTWFPQILPYSIIRCGDEYLKYERKGQEGRLHGYFSIGIGGHIDLEDMVLCSETGRFDPLQTISNAAKRELLEEADLFLKSAPETKWVLLSDEDEVGLVHAGFISIIDVGSKSLVKPREELINAKWVTFSELKSEQHLYEDWSSKLIGWLDAKLITQ